MPRLQSRLCVVFAPFVSQAFPQRTRDNRQTSRSASRNCKCSHIETRDKSPALGATKAIGLTAGRSAGQTHVSPKTMLWMLQFCSEQKIVAKIENNCKPLLSSLSPLHPPPLALKLASEFPGVVLANNVSIPIYCLHLNPTTLVDIRRDAILVNVTDSSNYMNSRRQI